MIVYDDFHKVFNEFESLDKFGTLYINRESWSRAPKATKLFLLSGDDELEDLDENGLPVLAAENGLNFFLDVEILQSVISVQIDIKEKSTLDEVIFAINYYLENDDFYDA
ncbi:MULTISPECIES: DUF7716 domain-containing protein [Pseudomonas]|uniref:DUF7716 domain-containing protein n=1 Tax=Pseudomonas quercus TaxID=2722792 RepID=A0ABX0YCY3_9PSED|nr:MULTISPECIES: hypothetical protein [Pseudomonas]MBF7142720.1 hypothetical protein [Pseudomonas sp. LY10J]NJP01258.1 hypothetical protein [Pseudomonas quercus]